ncbi:uncharacterized protein [Bemisia tabaci]|uniref:uncharacterized protein isoform X3 n=1 Tax=Bemisia tabaci TaxID=7038 RepID=UPI003B27CF0C
MAQEEGFQSYCIIDPLPSDVGDFDDSQREIVDISDVLLSSDEGEVDLRDGDDDEIDQFFNYLSSENVSDNSSPSVSGVGQGAVSDDDDSGEFVNYCENQESPSFMEPDPQLAEVIKFLREWSAENSTALVALSKLAKGLKQTHPVCFYNLPVDGRTIMGTYVRKLDVKKVPPGEYIHTGIQEQLEFAASLIPEDVNSFGLIINIDGVKIYKHTKSSLYVILMTIPTCKSLKGKVFPVGLYYGRGKPGRMDLFLKPFIEEMIKLLTNDLCIDQKIIKVMLLGFCCDTPARSEILETAGHSGFHSCFRCTTKGKSVSTKMSRGATQGQKKKQGRGSKRVFLDLDAPARDDLTFRNKWYPKHQPAKRPLTPLVQIPGLHFPRSFICDSMHLVFIGVTRALLASLFLAGPYMLKPSLRLQVQRKLEECIHFIPSDFQRKPADIRNVGGCKATESRLYLMYLGPVILKNSLDKERYIHFMELSIAIRIYHHASFCADDGTRKFAGELLRHFVWRYPQLYGEINVSHNVHTLQHLPDDIEWFKDSIPDFTLSDISAWAPENFNQVFRRFTRGYSKTLQQNIRRLGELFQTDFWRNKYKKTSAVSEVQFENEHKSGPLLISLKGQQFKKASFPNFQLCVNQADSTCGTESGDVIVVSNFVSDAITKEKFVVGKKFELKSEFFNEPLPESKRLGIYKVARLSSKVDKWPVSSITSKFIRLPYVKDETIPQQFQQKQFVVLPILHSEAGPTTS